MFVGFRLHMKSAQDLDVKILFAGEFETVNSKEGKDYLIASPPKCGAVLEYAPTYPHEMLLLRKFGILALIR